MAKASSTSNQQALSYDAGKVQAQGVFTSEIHIEARVSLQDVWNNQYHGSKKMGKRPGMYLKYLPCRFHEVSGDVLTGGLYLFKTKEEAEDYQNWTSNEFEVGEPKTTFWKQPLFKSVSHWTWNVVGAHNFVPVEEHDLGRFQRWTYDNEEGYKSKDAESLLRQLYPVLKDAAENRGAASFWLLHHPQDKMIAVQLSFANTDGNDPDSIGEALASVAEQSSLSDVFPDKLNARILLDRTSPYLALWFPLSESDDGIDMACPNFPDLPASHEK
ncbi:hypothetical protein FZEAL_5366 [Fusarium zealandicum]|uniref:Uncharacterized protein n=1 Tax=Fusarium zealandicum TaxID=1053134 RepID=A0A8H4UJT8_9HYPO|nr:hypothetical protein FZEAL_5366 [Fusarium zealandicum]